MSPFLIGKNKHPSHEPLATQLSLKTCLGFANEHPNMPLQTCTCWQQILFPRFHPLSPDTPCLLRLLFDPDRVSSARPLDQWAYDRSESGQPYLCHSEQTITSISCCFLHKKYSCMQITDKKNKKTIPPQKMTCLDKQVVSLHGAAGITFICLKVKQ